MIYTINIHTIDISKSAGEGQGEQSSKANNFWRINGFVDEELNNVIDKRVKKDACKRLIFIYDIK